MNSSERGEGLVSFSTFQDKGSLLLFLINV